MEPEKLSDFTDAKFWDNFFKQRGKKPFEWYGHFSDLLPLLEQHCGMVASLSAQLRILVPGCGNSELSAKMYDAGFKNIVNIDFSKVVIAEMLRQHLRSRPEMKWRVMDMTKMQFPNAAFDIVIDKGGLDAILGEPGEETKSAVQFLSEVERVLDRGGCYACVTLAQFHVVELLLSNYRHGWRVSIHQVAQLSEAPASELRPFLVVAKRDASTSLSLVAMSFDPLKVVEDHRKQVHFLQRVVQKENSLRKSMMDGHGTSQCLSHTGELEVIVPGRRISKTLGGNGLSRSSYSAVILDALESHGPFKYNCAVFLVPKGRTHEWLFSSEEGQWQVVESAKAHRLIMVFLDANFYCGSMEDIQEDLSPVIMRLQPTNCNGGGSIPYLMSSDGVVRRVILEEVESFLTGAMLVENVALSNDSQNQTGSTYEYFRRLVFRRNPNLIQSEARLVRLSGKLHGKARTGGKGSKLSKKKGRNEKDSLADLEFQVYHSFLASPYHAGMIAGLSLIASNLKKWVSCQELVRLVVVGLGAGLLPMFLHKHLPFGMIEVMELDPVVGDLAKRHFGFIEDERMKLNIADGLAVVNRKAVNGLTSGHNGHPGGSSETDDQRCPEKTGKMKENTSDGDALHVLIIDADSEDPSTGISCPPAEFLEETFLAAARDRLHKDGMLVINVVARAKAPHVDVPQKLQKVFAEVYGMEVDEDVNRVLFALPHSSGIESEEDMLRAADRLEELATSFAPWGKGPNLRDYVTKLTRY